MNFWQKLFGSRTPVKIENKQNQPASKVAIKETPPEKVPPQTPEKPKPVEQRIMPDSGAPYPLILLTGEAPPDRELFFSAPIFDHISSSTGVYAKDLFANQWNLNRSFKTVKATRQLNTDDLKGIAQAFWGDKCLDGNTYYTIKLHINSSLVLIITKANPNTESANVGYVSNFFPREGRFMLKGVGDFPDFNCGEKGERFKQFIDELQRFLNNYQAAHLKVEWNYEVLFHINFNNGKELEKFFVDLLVLLARYGKSNKKLIGWVTCPHGHPHNDFHWGFDLKQSGCAECCSS